jgi:hypothetical protein
LERGVCGVFVGGLFFKLCKSVEELLVLAVGSCLTLCSLSKHLILLLRRLGQRIDLPIHLRADVLLLLFLIRELLYLLRQGLLELILPSPGLSEEVVELALEVSHLLLGLCLAFGGTLLLSLASVLLQLYLVKLGCCRGLELLDLSVLRGKLGLSISQLLVLALNVPPRGLKLRSLLTQLCAGHATATHTNLLQLLRGTGILLRRLRC